MNYHHKSAQKFAVENRTLFTQLDTLIRDCTQSVQDLEWSNSDETDELVRLKSDLAYLTQLQKDGHTLFPLF